MERLQVMTMRWLSLPILCVSLAACSGGAPSTTSPPSGSSNPTFDVDALGIPRFAASNYLDLSSIAKIPSRTLDD